MCIVGQVVKAHIYLHTEVLEGTILVSVKVFEKKVDAARASKGSNEMMVAYQMALARLRGEDQCV